jgi:hypothetical protein
VTRTDRLTLQWLPDRYAICRLDAHAPLPEWALERGEDAPAYVISITRTERELSIVIDEPRLPPDLAPSVPIQRGFAALRIAGTLDFSLVGVIAKLTSALAAANISVFVLSTYDIDIILLPERDAPRAQAALRPIADLEAYEQHR